MVEKTQLEKTLKNLKPPAPRSARFGLVAASLFLLLVFLVPWHQSGSERFGWQVLEANLGRGEANYFDYGLAILFATLAGAVGLLAAAVGRSWTRSVAIVIPCLISLCYFFALLKKPAVQVEAMVNDWLGIPFKPSQTQILFSLLALMTISFALLMAGSHLRRDHNKSAPRLLCLAGSVIFLLCVAAIFLRFGDDLKRDWSPSLTLPDAQTAEKVRAANTYVVQGLAVLFALTALGALCNGFNPGHGNLLASITFRGGIALMAVVPAWLGVMAHYHGGQPEFGTLLWRISPTLRFLLFVLGTVALLIWAFSDLVRGFYHLHGGEEVVATDRLK